MVKMKLSPQPIFWCFTLMAAFAIEGFQQPRSPRSPAIQDTSAETRTEPASESQIHLITINGSINPVTVDFIMNAMESALEAGSQGLIIQLDTPGGLMESMRDIVKLEMEGELPVIVYVAPSGARSASAGVFITLAAHFAVMAPGTNMGAAHPVLMGGAPAQPGDTTNTMMDKVTNDAVAYMQAIAEKRGRNEEWARSSVLESASITATEALNKAVIDTIADSLPALLAYLDGKPVNLTSGNRKMQTKDCEVVEIPMNFRYRILYKIADPNIAYILLLLGIYGIFFELSNPGMIFPAVVGAICLILAFLALQMLPINYAGLALIILSIVLFIMEINITSYGLLSLGGIITLFLGSLMLVESMDPIMRISWKVLVPAVLFTAMFFLVAIGFGIKAQRRGPLTGRSGMVGQSGITQTELTPHGKVAVQGEIWNATSKVPISAKTPVRITAMSGMILTVEAEALEEKT